MVHHIQTKNWHTCNNVGIQAQNIKKQNISIIKKTKNYALQLEMTKSDFEVTQDGILSQEKNLKSHSHLNWFEIN